MIDPKDKQIREKLMARGVGSLTDAELVSVLLGDGGEKGSASAMAHELLSQSGDGALSSLARMDIGRLRIAAGIGVKRAAVLAAAFEVGRRAGQTEGLTVQSVVTDDDIVRIFKPKLSELPHEEFWVLFLSSSNRIIDRAKVSQGGISGTVVEVKLILKRAVELLCPSIIVVHNHPSGQSRPSDDDITLTQQLSQACALLDIALLDHVIITRGESFSFRREKLIK